MTKKEFLDKVVSKTQDDRYTISDAIDKVKEEEQISSQQFQEWFGAGRNK